MAAQRPPDIDMSKKSPKTSRKNQPRVKLASGARKPAHPGGLGRGLDALIGREATRNVAAPANEENRTVAPAGEASGAASGAPPRPAPSAPPRIQPAPPPTTRGSAAAVLDVPISLVRPSPWQPRRAFDEDALAELADSIRAHGIIQPLVCRRQDGFYELIGGERRLRAASLAGLTSVPVVTADAGDREAAELALVENLQREDLNPIEEAEGYKALAENFKLTQADIAERVGKARASVANALRLLDLPDEVRRMVGEGLLSGGHAKALLAMPGEGERIELARQCLGEGLSVRALERRVARKLEAPSKRPAPRPDVPEDWLRTLTDKIRTRLATPVRLFPSTTYANGRHGRGHLEIDFFDNDDLTRLLELLGVDVNEP